MKKKIIKIRCSIVLTTTAIALALALPMKCWALNGQEQRRVESLSYVYTHLGEDAAYESIKAYPISSEGVQELVNHGAFPNYVEELKALGYTDVDYSPVTGGSSESQPAAQEETSAPAPEPEAFTVEDMLDTPMWTISEVNYRDGASTDYAKIGTLAKYDEVTVNGKASTGWYRFVLEDGTEAYVSDKYLTTDDPNTATEDTEEAPEETEAAPTVETEPEPAVEVPEPVVEEPAEPEIETPEPVTEEPEQIEEPPVVEEETAMNGIPIVVGAVVGICVIGAVVVVLIRKKKS